MTQGFTYCRQLAGAFSARPPGPHTLQLSLNKARRPFKTQSGEAGWLISTIRNGMETVLCNHTVISHSRPRKHAGNTGKTLVQGPQG